MNRMIRPVGVTLSRRSFLVSLGAAGLSIGLGAAPARTFAAGIAENRGEGLEPNIWVKIDTEGTVTLVSPSAEMGQGVLTSVPLLIAEDMEADWNRIRVVQAPADMAYGNAEFGGVQLTGGSTTTRAYYNALRLAGAEARLVLTSMAAGLLGVSVQSLRAEQHRIIDDASGRSLGFGEIAASGALPDPLPLVTEADLKPASRFRYIGGSSLGRIDVPAKVNGSAVYGVDVDQAGLLHGLVLRSPVQGETPEAVDDAEAAAIPGVLRIVTLPYGVGLIGTERDALVRARDLLTVTWSSTSRARGYSSEAMLQRYRDIASDLTITGGVALDEGNALLAIEGATTILTADYLNDHIHHATMEPMTATARFDGDHAHVWAPTQAQSLTVWATAGLLEIDSKNVTLTTTLAGGGLGRKAEDDFISDAVLLAREVEGRPLKVIWTREDDVRHGKYRPLVAHYARIGLDAAGKIVGWHQRLAADSIYARWYPDAFEELKGLDDTVYGGLENGYDLPAHRVEYLRQDGGVAVGFSRATAEGYTKFGVECMVDEAAAAAQSDPLQFRLELLAHDVRAAAVLRAAAEMADWGRAREDRALGLAYSKAWGTHCAQVAEVSLDRQTGVVSVHQVWCAVDPGIAIQPVNIEAQIMGGIIQGVGTALHEQINFVDGEVKESNLDTYRVLRMSEIPDVHVRVIATDNPPSGIGEVGLPPVAPAIANAVARLTDGVRLRHMPFLPERVLAALSD
ncbi:molybdopterin cofactor-binding domain-containing protein [Brucella sp. BE17]|uniref:xanthine dehydrogenase family protein molybdopterin-binding subunit n=1 Tax=Brucella sp. BE17 TaxID=3142977 RepID=UPI0031BB087E